MTETERKTAMVCPECRAGKHPNCTGDGGFDPVTDEPVVCDCWLHGHGGR